MPIVFWVYMIWTIQHLTQQNLGILLLYHNPTEAVVPRAIEARSLQIPAALFGALLLLHPVTPGPVFGALVTGSICLCILLCCHYLWHLYQQTKGGAPTNVPALMFWLLSAWFFLPLAFVGEDFFLGMAVPLFAHWCQYIGLNCFHVVHKSEAESKNHGLLRRPIVAFIVFCAGFTAFIFGLSHWQNALNEHLWKDCLAGLLMGFSLVHYFQDAFIWRFREQYQRETILAYLKPGTRS